MVYGEPLIWEAAAFFFNLIISYKLIFKYVQCNIIQPKLVVEGLKLIATMVVTSFDTYEEQTDIKCCTVYGDHVIWEAATFFSA